MPPIVTGKHAAVSLSEQAPVSEMPTQAINTDRWRVMQYLAANQPPATMSGKVPSVSASVAPQENTSLSSEQEAVSEMPTQSINTGPWRTIQYLAASQPSATASGKVPYPLSPKIASAQPTSVRQNLDPSEQSNPQRIQEVNSSDSRYKLKRRRVISLLAAGVIGVAVCIAALNLNLLGIASSQRQTQPIAAGQLVQSQQSGHMGTVIGHTTLALNAASTFTNPADSQRSLLIHLPDSKFVAYETACTHEQVPVYYDSKTKELVCLADGAIFDPARGGAVVQGPATRPLSSVKISVNSDETITAG